MAVIGKIRQRSGLLIFLIGASIVGFLVMDATNSQGSVLKGRKDSIGSVNGEEISQVAFESKLSENVKNQEEQMRQPLNDDMRNYMRNQTWTEMVNEIIFKRAYDKLGINVTSEELSDLATNPEFASQYIQQDQSFRNPQTGQFDPAMVRMYLQNLDKDPQGVEPGTVRKQWTRFEGLLKKQQFQDKYNNLISKGIYVPTWQAEMAYIDQNKTTDFKYVAYPYTDVAEADVKVTDEDLQQYLDAHKAKFKRDEETRKLQYVTFDIIPSSADTARTLSDLNEKFSEFVASKTASEDSVFVKLYSETAFDDKYYTKDELTSSMKDTLFAVANRTVVGPYQENGSLKYAKVSDRKMLSDSVRVREIKFSFNNITTQEQGAARVKLVDSVFAAIDTFKADFGLMAMMHSDDAAAKMQGGNVGWVKQGQRSKFYNDLLFYRAQKGKLYKIPSQEDNAWFIFQIVEDKPTKPAVQVAFLSREILPSQETQNTIYGSATAFSADNQTDAKFKEAGKKLNIKVLDNVKQEDFSLGALGSARALIRWAYDKNTEKGQVSQVITLDNKHVVALLESISPKGTAPVDAVREELKALVTREKKAELLKKKIADAKAASVDELAAKSGKSALPASGASFSNPNLNGAYEPKVVAAALAVGVNKMSAAIEGNAGVYVVQPSVITEPNKISDYSIYGMQLKNTAQNKARSAAEAQKKLAKIEDDRFTFF